MTDLNLSLWVAGGTVILGVIFYNFWQEYKAKKNIERAFGQHQDDVLMKSDDMVLNSTSNAIQRQEPTLNPHWADPELLNDTESSPHQAASTGAEVLSQTAVQTTLHTASEEALLLPIDDFIDCIITMEFESPMTGDKIMNEVQSFRRVGSKPVHFIGTNIKGQREILQHGTSYTHLLAGVQLVTRSSALNELEYSELVTKLRQIADNLNAYPDIPDMKHVMDAGRDLHLFVTEYDAQLSVNVHTKGAPWGMSALLAALEKHGFDTRPDGRLAMPDGQGGSLFTLSTNCSVSGQETKRITLLLDVPCVAPSRSGFNAMVSCAKSLALRLDGSLVDDGNELLSDATLHQIQEQVELFYNAMQAAEIPAGSTRAVRIFS